MEQGTGKITDIRDLLLDLQGKSDEEIESVGRQNYSDLFLTIAKRGIHKLHDGQDIAFFLERFDHAFFKSIKWQDSEKKEIIERGRVERVKWILPMIQGEVPNSECWLKNSGEQRFYVCFGLRYIVWVESRDVGGWRFSSAYNAEPFQLRGYTKNAKRIWQYNKKRL